MKTSFVATYNYGAAGLLLFPAQWADLSRYCAERGVKLQKDKSYKFWIDFNVEQYDGEPVKNYLVNRYDVAAMFRKSPAWFCADEGYCYAPPFHVTYVQEL